MAGDKEDEMPIMEISIVPIGTGTPSISDYVAAAVSTLECGKCIRCSLTAMGTIVEGENLKDLLRVAAVAHESVFAAGAARVLTSIKIDDRRDRKMTMAGKIAAVRKILSRRPGRR